MYNPVVLGRNSELELLNWHMSPRRRWGVDQDVEQFASARLDQDVLTEQSALLHAQEHFYFIRYRSSGMHRGIQAYKDQKQNSVTGIISLLLIGVPGRKAK
jgi:hypothetical protein